MEFQSHSQCQKDTTRPPKVVHMHWVRPQGDSKTRTNCPRPGARRRRCRSGRGLEGRAHQAASRRPRSEAETGVRGTSNKVFVLEVKYKGCRLSRRPFALTPGMHTAALIFRARICGRPKSENKRPQPQSNRAGAVETLFATF